MTAMLSDQTMRRAFAEKDSSFDGTFFVAVRTTGIFCRPVCRAKPPRPENIEFFPDAQHAMRYGYRPCKLCRPLEEGSRLPELVTRLMELVEQRAPDHVSEQELQEAGIDPSTARRQFQASCKMTFAEYQRARRIGAAFGDLRKGRGVADAQAGAGFESGSGFRAAFARMVGANASDANTLNAIHARWIPSPLGPMIAIASEQGIVFLDFLDRDDLDRAMARLREQFASNGRPAPLFPDAEHPHLATLAKELVEYFAGKRHAFTVPIIPGGTPFQQRACAFLRSIPFGQTRTYGQQAHAIGSPHASRAVGRANGSNDLVILVPCHRVVGANGALTGFGGGLARKQWLLDHERRAVKWQEKLATDEHR